MNSINNLFSRGKSALAVRELSDSSSFDDSTMNAMIALLALVLSGLLLTLALMMLRRHRQQLLDQQLPSYNDIENEAGRNTRRLTIQTPNGMSSIVVVNGRPMLADPHSPPNSPKNVPEIHITFPDEKDEHGRHKNGKVLLVRVGDTTIGLEPLRDEQLPAYEKQGNNDFYSIDMDRIGGFKEKDGPRF
jgi:hypothetical protein